MYLDMTHLSQLENRPQTIYIPCLIWRMSRPLQLIAVSMVFAWGVIVASVEHPLNKIQLIVGFAALMAVTVSIHLINEYADVETDALTQRTAYSGGSGALSETGASPAIALVGAWIALLVGVLIAIIGVLTGPISIQAFGLLMLGAFFGWMYSVRPLALAWNGWGELDNSLLGALLLPLFGYVLARGSLNWSTILLFLPFTGLAFLNLLATTWADKEADGIVGKQTLAVKWSERRLRRLYLTVGTLTYLIIVFQNFLQFPRYVILVGFLTFPLSIWGFHTYTRKQDPSPSVIAMSVYMTLQIGVWLLLSRT